MTTGTGSTGRSASSRRRSHAVRTRPPAPPSTKSSRVSVSNCRARQQHPRDVRPDDAWVGVEALVPPSGADDGHGVRSLDAVFGRPEDSSTGRSDAEHREVVSRHHQPEHAVHAAPCVQAERHRIDAVRGHAAEDIGAVPVIRVVGIRERVEPAWVLGSPEIDQAVGIGDARPRAQQQGVGQAEDRGARRQAKGQRHHGCDGERRALPEEPGGETEIRTNRLQNT